MTKECEFCGDDFETDDPEQLECDDCLATMDADENEDENENEKVDNGFDSTSELPSAEV